VEPIEQAVVRECLRNTFKILGYDSLSTDMAEALHAQDQRVDLPSARKYLLNQNIAENVKDRASLAALAILKPRMSEIKRYYAQHDLQTSLEVIQYVININDRDLTIAQDNSNSKDADTRPNLRHIIENWKRPIARGEDVLRSGIYQIFRRYKPTVEQKRFMPQYEHDENHAIICELVYVDSTKMECSLVTAERNVYWGYLYINHQSILYVLAQRPSDENDYGVHQRSYTIKLESGWPTVYGGLCMKSGDTTKMPLSSECIFLAVPKGGHSALYDEFDRLRSSEWQRLRVSESSIILDYITDLPPLK
jgi:hypothetical protein